MDLTTVTMGVLKHLMNLISALAGFIYRSGVFCAFKN
jgi:hypothetical protein